MDNTLRQDLENLALHAAALQRKLHPQVVKDLADRGALHVHPDGIVTGAHDAIDLLLEQRAVPADRRHEPKPPRFTIDGGGGQRGDHPFPDPPQHTPVDPAAAQAWRHEAWRQGIGAPEPPGPRIQPVKLETTVDRAPTRGERPHPWEVDPDHTSGGGLPR